MPARALMAAKRVMERTSLDEDWLLGNLAARVTSELASDKTQAGLAWKVVIDGLNLPNRPALTWTANEARARDARLEMARVEAEVDAEAASGGAAATPAIDAAERAQRHAALLGRVHQDIEREKAEREAAAVVLTVEQYASLCAERRLYPHALAQVAQRYGFSSQAAVEAEDAEWRGRFAADPQLATRFQQVQAEWLAWLQQR